MADEPTKTCKRCQTDLPLSAFNRRSRSSDKHHSWCRACLKPYQDEWHAKNREREAQKAREYREANADVVRPRARAAHLKHKYGITPDVYDRMLAQQGGKCAICGGTNAGMSHMLVPLVIDHCHDTGDIRGLLCSGCNAGLGNFKDNPDALLAAAAYLLRREPLLQSLLASDEA